MSLFENDQFQWRETYFVMFTEARRPSNDAIVTALNQLGKGFRISDVSSDKYGLFESLTVQSPDDYAAMDISYVSGEEVTEQVAELATELQGTTESEEEASMLQRLPDCTARLDVYHFEQTVELGANEEGAELMDPGALLTILQCLARLCDGVVIDPQTGILL